MAKRKQSRKQREASLKNLRKARRARKKDEGKTTKRKRRSSGKRRQSRKQRAAALKNLSKGRRKHRKSRKSTPEATPKRRRKAGRRKAHKVGHRRARRSAGRTRVVKQTIIKRVPTGGVVVLPSKHRRRKARRGGKRRHHRRSTRRSGESRRSRGAMENPMTGTELFVGSVTGLAGFLAADVLDRFLATHALTANSTTTGGTQSTYTDTPPTTGDYAGLMNATAVAAPMDATRWLAGLGLAATPIIIAHFVTAPTGRAALQFFGFAAGLRIVGKGLIDMTAQLMQSSQIGQQLYDGEMRAALLQQSQGQTSTALQQLPSSGLGRPRGRLGAGAQQGCAPCAAQAGAAGTKKGTGYPSMPVTPAGLQALTPAGTTPTNTAPTAPTTTPTNTTPASTPAASTPTTTSGTAPGGNTSGLTGPRGVARPNRNPRNRFGNWGAAE